VTDQDKLKIAAKALEQSIGGQAACLRAVELTLEALRGEVPPVLTRDLAEILGSTVPAVCAALVKAGRPPRSTNMAVSGEEALEVAQALRGAVPAGWKLVPTEPSDEWISRLDAQQTGELEEVDADAIRQCIVELLAAAPQPAAQPTEPAKWMASFTKFKDVYDSYVKYNSSYYSSLSDALDIFVGECSSFAATTSTQQEPAGEPVAARVVRRILPEEDERPEESTYDVQWIGVDPYKFAGDLFTRPAVPLTEREIELIDGMIEAQLHHAAQCDAIQNRTMADKQKGWDMERVELLRKFKAHKIGGTP
jgi:hypothetical protein